jgi:hypothetical protein
VSEISATEKISERIVSRKVVPSGVEEVVAGTAGAGQGEAGRVAESKEITGLQEAKAEGKGWEKEAPLQTQRAVLPEEYGENSVTLITVDPYRLFAFWEVRKETLETFRGEVDIRVYDVTDIDFDTMDANSYLDIKVDARIGKCYVSVNPEREYIADVGIIFDGIFIAIARSAKVSTPRSAVSEERILLYGVGETGFWTGY